MIDLLGSLDCSIPNLQFQKLLFLYCQEPDSASLYEFVPYRFGAFSFTSYADRRKLIDRGLLVDEESRWQLTPSGRRSVVGLHHPGMVSFLDRYRMLQGDALVAESYRRFPYYAIRSEIAEEVLYDDKKALQRIEAARPQTIPSTLLTIGYEARSLEYHLNVLLQEGVSLLCDVRRNAVSRKYGFSKSTLSNACATLGIRYEHLPELGISAERRRAVRGRADYSRLFREYEKHHLPQQPGALATVTQWIRSGECVALMCYERDAENCHRSRVAAEIDRQTGVRPPVRHL